MKVKECLQGKTGSKKDNLFYLFSFNNIKNGNYFSDPSFAVI